MANDVKVNGGISFAGLLAIAFIVLKLTKVINWSWWWVVSPLWLPIALVLVILIVLAIYWGVKR
jgi:hypothetical protein